MHATYNQGDQGWNATAGMLTAVISVVRHVLQQTAVKKIEQQTRNSRKVCTDRCTIKLYLMRCMRILTEQECFKGTFE